MNFSLSYLDSSIGVKLSNTGFVQVSISASQKSQTKVSKFKGSDTGTWCEKKVPSNIGSIGYVHGSRKFEHSYTNLVFDRRELTAIMIVEWRNNINSIPNSSFTFYRCCSQCMKIIIWPSNHFNSKCINTYTSQHTSKPLLR